jgi:hypothetical protein
MLCAEEDSIHHTLTTPSPQLPILNNYPHTNHFLPPNP